MELSFNLGLAVLPETKSADFAEFLRLYNAIKLVAARLDVYTGYAPVAPGEQKPLHETVTVGQQTTLYLPCNTAITAGSLCTTVQVGDETRARTVGFGAHGMARFIAMQDAEVGDVGKFLLFGLIYFEEGGLSAGETYYNVGSGYLDKQSSTANYWTRQAVGYALTTNHLWFQPDWLFGAYTAPP